MKLFVDQSTIELMALTAKKSFLHADKNYVHIVSLLNNLDNLIIPQVTNWM